MSLFSSGQKVAAIQESLKCLLSVANCPQNTLVPETWQEGHCPGPAAASGAPRPHRGPSASSNPGLGLVVSNSPRAPFPDIPSLRDRLEKQMDLKFKGLPWEVRV